MIHQKSSIHDRSPEEWRALLNPAPYEPELGVFREPARQTTRHFYRELPEPPKAGMGEGADHLASLHYWERINLSVEGPFSIRADEVITSPSGGRYVRVTVKKLGNAPEEIPNLYLTDGNLAIVWGDRQVSTHAGVYCPPATG